jgi:hypothetical protein
MTPNDFNDPNNPNDPNDFNDLNDFQHPPMTFYPFPLQINFLHLHRRTPFLPLRHFFNASLRTVGADVIYSASK